MTIVCQSCFRVLKDGQWVVEIAPIEKVQHTTCPQCQAKEKPASDSSRNMAYFQNKRKSSGK